MSDTTFHHLCGTLHKVFQYTANDFRIGVAYVQIVQAVLIVLDELNPII